jgi:hypothetical protein
LTAIVDDDDDDDDCGMKCAVDFVCEENKSESCTLLFVYVEDELEEIDEENKSK